MLRGPVDAHRENGVATSDSSSHSSTTEIVRQSVPVEIVSVDSDDEQTPQPPPVVKSVTDDVVVQFAASKIALLIGLHEFGDVSEAILEYVYQNQEDMLARDAKTLDLHLVSKDQELDELMAKTGTSLAPQFQEILQWTRDRRRPASQAAATELLKSVDELVTQARGKRKLQTQEALEMKRQLSERIHLSYGCRNEDLALQTYEKQTGSAVRLSNQAYYFLRFPRLECPMTTTTTTVAVDYAQVEQAIERRVVDRGATRHDDDDDQHEHGNRCYFTICGMIDGVADTLDIANDDGDNDDDAWRIVPILLEVKNRMRAFRVPPPLYDYIQMAVYLKMVGLVKGDLVQCLHGDRAQIHVTRVALSEYPLNCGATTCTTTTTATPVPSKPIQSGLWTTVILPRLYTIVQTIDKLRREDRLRLAFLNGSETQRLVMLRRECDFL